jgi:hypothetical protein
MKRAAGLLRRLAVRLGRRGASLLFLGSLSMILAASLLLASPQQATIASYRMLATIAPLAVWGISWLISGLICWTQAFMLQDRIAFALTTAMWWLYGLAHITGIFTGVNPRGWVGGLLWIAFGGWVNLIATWEESDRVVAARAQWKVSDG